MKAPGSCVLLFLLMLGGCQTLPAPPGDQGDAAAVLSGRALFGEDPLPALPREDILGMSPDMRAFLKDNVDRRASAVLRLRQLAWAVTSEASFGLQYTSDTRTAAGTFDSRNGNCLSFTNMFVAMAREVGLKARFQQVDVPPDWEQRGDTWVLSRHVNVLVELPNGARQAVDFNLQDFKSSYDRRPVPDRRAEAHFYSNRGVEKLQQGDFRAAFLYLRAGLDLDPGFSALWTNLGALYARADQPALAELSYHEALRLDDNDMVATSGLARLLERRGDHVAAARYESQARRHRDRNPYYRFHLGREAFLARDFELALRHLDYAIGKRPVEDSFYFLRGMVHLQMGNARQAREDLERAEAIAEDDTIRSRYHGKMEMLLREAAGSD